MNDLARCVQQCIRLGLVDHAAADRLQVDIDAHDCSALLVQGAGEAYKVIAMIGRELQAMEQATSFLKQPASPPCGAELILCQL